MRHHGRSLGLVLVGRRIMLTGVLSLGLSPSAHADLVRVDLFGGQARAQQGNQTPLGGIDLSWRADPGWTGYWEFDPDARNEVSDPNHGLFLFDDPRNRIHLDINDGRSPLGVVSFDFQLTRISYLWWPPDPAYAPTSTLEYSVFGTLVTSSAADVTGGDIQYRLSNGFAPLREFPFESAPLPPASPLQRNFAPGGSGGGGSQSYLNLVRAGGDSRFTLWAERDPATGEYYRIRPVTPAAVPEPGAALVFGYAFLIVSHALRPRRRDGRSDHPRAQSGARPALVTTAPARTAARSSRWAG